MNRREFLKLSTTSGVAALAASPLSAADAIGEMRAESKAVQDAKRAKLAALRKLGPTITNFEVRRKKDIPGKRAAFYIDDVLFVFRDLAATKPKSCWEHPFLAHLREAWERYGVKTQLNLFYRGDFFYGVKEAMFSLKNVPDMWKGEFQAAKEWLRFGFHSLNEYPDYPWISASYEDVSLAWNMTKGEVERFAGPGMWATAVVPHWGSISRDGCMALRDGGATLVSVSRGDRWEYNGDRTLMPYGHGYRIENHRKPESAIFWRGNGGDDISVSASGYNHLDVEQVVKTLGTYNWIHDLSTGVNFKASTSGGPLLNIYGLKDVAPAFDRAGEKEYFCYATHEQYFFKDYFMYQPDYAAKTLASGKWMYDHGYSYIFMEDSIDA